MLTRVNLNVTDAMVNPLSFQCSMYNVSMDLCTVVTGHDTYRFYKIAPDFSTFELVHSQLMADGHAPGQSKVSTEYSCHTWTKDTGNLVVATEQGDIIICNYSGEFKAYV
jgi:hypothetical protein